MTADAAGTYGEHRGLVYRGHSHLLISVVATVRTALDQGHRVVVGIDRRARVALSAALGNVLDRPGTISWADSGSLPRHEAAAFAECLRSLVPTTGRLVVLQHYSTDAPVVPQAPELDLLLSANPITLLCTCPITADPEVMRTFRETHTSPTRHRVPSPMVLETTLRGIGDLRDLRARLGYAATRAGFTPRARDRAVLAVHEAATLACRLVGRADELAINGRAPTTPASTTLRLHTWTHRIEVEINLPRGACFPVELRDDDPLRHIRAFCQEASWVGSLHPRRIRIVA